MEAKKKEHLKLEKNSGLYFVMGMTLILALVYTALEWKTFETNTKHLTQLSQPDYLPDEQAPYIKPPELPKPKPVATPEITIVDDEDDIIEDAIKSTESNPEILIPKETNFEDLPEIDDEVPFMVIEYVPVFPGCEGADDKRACFQEKMLKHVKKNFKYPANAIEMGQHGRVSVLFTIQKDGTIGDVRMRGPHQILEDEAARIISKLPKMEPGKQGGQAVKVPFSIPITFKLQ
jgi:protein TonB